MPLDRFLIAIDYDTLGNLLNFTRVSIMSKRKQRSDCIDISGKKFGDLTALKVVNRGKYQGAMWLCKCDCGKECLAMGGHLRNGKRKSCGCRSESRIHETGINRIFSNYKRKSRLRELEFSISRDKFEKLILSNCHYCGREPHQILKRLKSKKLQIQYNGIDRFNPNEGYTNENCVSCCYYCNHAKADLTFVQWLSHLKKIITYQGITNGT